MESALRESVLDASRRAEVLGAVRELYGDVQRQIDARKPLCAASGRCCRFEQYGHRLFVTTIELAAFVEGLGPQRPGVWDGVGCPFQVQKLCGVHTIRPFGCRMFYCDPSSTDWQNAQYEIFHERLKRLHETLNVPYFYVEWRQGLRAVLSELDADALLGPPPRG